jgi:ABC-2 type transport system ATP-binding protein
MNAVELHGVTKIFGRQTAVDDLSFVVPRGGICGFLGPNGSGKTTTLRMILSIFFPDQGRISVLGQTACRRLTETLGYLPEERGLYRGMKVRETLLFYGGLRANRNLAKEADHWLDRFGIRDWANKKVDTLSKGMTQKVQFLATIVSNPQILILDEPFSGLDPVNAEAIRLAMLELRAGGTTILLSTHDMHTAETLCDHLVMIHRGRKVLDGTLATIQDQYGSNVVHLQTKRPVAGLQTAPGADSVRDLGHTQEVRLLRDADPQALLRWLVDQGEVQRFEIGRPTLHDIFVRIAAPDAEEVKHA